MISGQHSLPNQAPITLPKQRSSRRIRSGQCFFQNLFCQHVNRQRAPKLAIVAIKVRNKDIPMARPPDKKRISSDAQIPEKERKNTI